MSFKFEESLASSMLSSFKQMACLSYNSIGALELNESLSVFGQNHLNTLKFCTLQINRLCNTLSFLMDTDTHAEKQLVETFEIENLIHVITDNFSQTVSSYSPVSAEYRLNLKKTLSIVLNKTKFELIFLNLLYCCLKKRPGSKPVPLKLWIYVTENKDNIVFHIRDNNDCKLNPEIVHGAFSELSSIPNGIDDTSFDTLISLSLHVVQKSAKQINASISYVPLKSGNRFDISLPKAKSSTTNYLMRSPVPYIPTYRFYNETFADIRLEAVLQKIVNNFEGWEDFLL